MRSRRVLPYFSWSRPAETSASLPVIEDRFPAIFELHRLFYSKLEPLSDRDTIDQGIAGFLDHVQKPNLQDFAKQTELLTGNKVVQIECINDDSIVTGLDAALDGIDSIIVISFDSLRTDQAANKAEIGAIKRFLDDPDHLIFVCPHYDIGEAEDLVEEARAERQLAEHRHHGDQHSTAAGFRRRRAQIAGGAWRAGRESLRP
jgi:hypothetical protein